MTDKHTTKYRYSEWSGNPNGHAYRPADCAYEVFPARGIPAQCCNRNGKGPHGLFCGTHAKIVQQYESSLALWLKRFGLYGVEWNEFPEVRR
jgi:hypothetical protein